MVISLPEQIETRCEQRSTKRYRQFFQSHDSSLSLVLSIIIGLLSDNDGSINPQRGGGDWITNVERFSQNSGWIVAISGFSMEEQEEKLKLSRLVQFM